MNEWRFWMKFPNEVSEWWQRRKVSWQFNWLKNWFKIIQRFQFFNFPILVPAIISVIVCTLVTLTGSCFWLRLIFWNGLLGITAGTRWEQHRSPQRRRKEKEATQDEGKSLSPYLSILFIYSTYNGCAAYCWCRRRSNNMRRYAWCRLRRPC